MNKSTIQPFAGSVSWLRWTDYNCRQCKKDCSYNAETGMTISNCDIEEAIGIAYITDEIPKALADRAGLPERERCKEFEAIERS